MSNDWNFTPRHYNWPNSQITQCTCSISQNVPFRTWICTFGYGIGTLWSLWDSLWTGCLLYAEVQKWCRHMPGQQVIQLGHTWGHLQLVQGLIIETLWFFITIVMVESGNVFLHAMTADYYFQVRETLQFRSIQLCNYLYHLHATRKDMKYKYTLIFPLQHSSHEDSDSNYLSTASWQSYADE